MVSTARPGTFGSTRASGPYAIYAMALGLTSGLAAVVLVISTLFAIGDDARDSLVMVLIAAVLAAHAGYQARRPFEARSMKPVPTFAAVTLCYIYLAALSTVVYLATGSFDRFDDAVYESVTGVSTSSLTVLEDPAVLTRGVLIWRSGTQWLGGLGALALSVAIFPFVGGSREMADPRQRGARRMALAPRPVPALKRVGVLYGVVSLLVTIAFLIVGMSLPDAVAHMMSSVSTGGFSTHSDSIAHFDSVAVEIVTIVVMAGAGFSLALAWMLLRGLFHDTLRVFELRVYALVLVATSAWVFWLQGRGEAISPQSTTDRIIDSVFTTVSLSTTTGHRTVDWGTWGPGAEMALVVLFVIGGMAGSVAGGFKWVRVVGLAQFVWRELMRQLHPRAVRSVKVGGSTISERSVDNWHSQLVLSTFAAGGGAMLLAFFGSEIIEAFTLAFSAVSTTGPAIANDGTILVTAADVSRIDRVVLTPLMLMGRLAIYPALVLVGVVWFGAERRIAGARWRRAGRRS